MYFDLLGSTLSDKDGARVIPPENIYNVDETGFTICQQVKRLLNSAFRDGLYVCSIYITYGSS